MPDREETTATSWTVHITRASDGAEVIPTTREVWVEPAPDGVTDATTDILALLREEDEDESWCGDGGLFQRAADEIERLRAREKHLLSVIRDYNPDDALFDAERGLVDGE